MFDRRVALISQVQVNKMPDSHPHNLSIEHMGLSLQEEVACIYSSLLYVNKTHIEASIV